MFASLVLLWVFIWIAILHFKSQRPKNFPPGPLNVPLLGSVFHLSLENPLKDFEKVIKMLFVELCCFIILRKEKWAIHIQALNSTDLTFLL